MDFALLPPEVNSARMYAGPGSGPMLAASAAWDGLAADLESTAATYQSAIAGLISGPWLGPSSMSMAAAAMPYATWMRTTATQAAQSAAQPKIAAGAYEAAFAMTVPPPVIAANRSLLMSLIATNVLGQNTAAIAATEAHYMEMWAQDAAAMYGYAGQSAAASTLTPFTRAPNTTNPAGLAGQTAAVAQTTGTSAGTGAQTIASMGPQLLSAVPATLQGLAQPLQSTSGLSGILDDLGFTSLQSYLSLGNLVVPYTASLATVNLGIGASHAAHTAGSGRRVNGCGALRDSGRDRLGRWRAGVGWSGGPGRVGGDRGCGSGNCGRRTVRAARLGHRRPGDPYCRQSVVDHRRRRRPGGVHRHLGNPVQRDGPGGYGRACHGRRRWPRPPAVRRGC